MKVKTRFETFSEKERKMLAEAIWRRQRSYIAGDKLFNEYGKNAVRMSRQNGLYARQSSINTY